MSKDCEKCGEPNSPRARKCHACGAGLAGAKQTQGEGEGEGRKHDPDRHRCQWRDGDIRCPALGTWSPSINGGGPWYCTAHGKCHDKVLGAQIIEDYSRNGVPRRDDWRVRLVESRMKA